MSAVSSGEIHAHAIEEVPERDLRLAAVPGEELGEEPRGSLLLAASGGVLGHAVRQPLGNERDARIGLAQLLGCVRRAGCRPGHFLPRLFREREPLELEPVAEAKRAQDVIPVVRLDRGEDVGAGAVTSLSWSHDSNSTMLVPASRRPSTRRKSYSASIFLIE